jgi:purine catabolism regulator
LHTVGEIAVRHGLNVRAGQSELGRLVGWATTCDLSHPASVVSRGDLVLTYGVGLATTSAPEYVAELVSREVAGLVVGLGPVLSETPPAVVAAAARANLPLLERLDPNGFDSFLEPLLTRLLQVKAAEGQRLAHARTMLIHAATVGGAAQIVTTLADLIGGWAVIVDRAGRPQQATGGARLHIDDAVAAASGYPRRVRFAEIAVHRIGENRPGSAALVAGFRPGIEALARELAGTATELLTLLSRQPDGEGSLRARRLAMAGLLDSSAVLRSRIADEWQLGEVDLVVARVRSRSRSVFLEEAALRWVEEMNHPILVAGEGPTVTAIIPVDLIPEWCERLETAVRIEGIPVRCGLGTKATAANLAMSLRQADQALEVALADGRVIADYADLPTSRLVAALQGAGALADRAFAKLDQAGIQGETLIASLHVFLAENGNWEAAAAQLGIHRHTLRHRMQRIEEHTGRDLSSMEDRVELWVALRIRGFGSD